MERRDINLVLAGGGLGWLAMVLVLALGPVEGARWNILGMAMLVYPILWLMLMWVVDALYARRTKRPSEAPTDA